MAEDLTRIVDRLDRTVRSVLRQFRGQPNIEAKMASYGQEIQEIEDMFIGLYIFRSLDDAEGVQLDRLGDMVNEKRGSKNDENYRAAIRGRIVIDSGDATVPDVYFAMKFVHDANYRIFDVGDATLRCRLLDAIPPTLDPSTLGHILRRNVGGGIGSSFEYSAYDEDDTFRWAPGLTREITTTTGFADVARTYGGKRSNVA